MPKQLIIRSFKVCGITAAIDGTEDEAIHCMKMDELAESLQMLKVRSHTEAAMAPEVGEPDVDSEPASDEDANINDLADLNLNKDIEKDY